MKTLPPLHPGEVLREEFLNPLGITPYRLAKELRVSRPAVNDLCRGKRSLSPKMAALLAKYFGTSVHFWLNLQSLYDLQRIERDQDIQRALLEIVPLSTG